MINILLHSPRREYLIFILIPIGLIINANFPEHRLVLLTIASFAAYPVILKAFWSLLDWHLSIELFYAFALITVFAVGDLYSGSFIVLMLAFARLLDHRMRSKAHHPSDELRLHKQEFAIRENETVVSTIAVERVRPDDIVIIKKGEQIPVDGVVVFGKTEVDESVITGSKKPVEKIIGDEVLAASHNLDQPIKIRAVKIGKHSTLEKMIQIIEEGLAHKSKEEIVSDRFAFFFYPFMLIVGIAIYAITGNLMMTVAFFLIMSISDIVPAIPSVITAALKKAAQQGVIVKGSKTLQSLSKAKTLVLDKTHALTFGDLAITDVFISEGVSSEDFWKAVAIAEKYSDHPVGKALFRESVKKIFSVPNAQKYQVYKGSGVYAKYGKDNIVVGNTNILKEYKLTFPRGFKKQLEEKYNQLPDSLVYVGINGAFVGYVATSDNPPSGASKSIDSIRKLGFSRVVLLSAENEIQTLHTSDALGVAEYYFGLSAEEKASYVERFAETGPVVMVSDGINNMSALSKAAVRVAIGKNGRAIDSEYAHVIMLHDDLSKLPELIELARKNTGIIYGNVATWLISNSVGFVLVLFGIQPWLAAFYKFATDFIPVINSTRLYRERGVQDVL